MAFIKGLLYWVGPILDELRSSFQDLGLNVLTSTFVFMMVLFIQQSPAAAYLTQDKIQMPLIRF